MTDKPQPDRLEELRGHCISVAQRQQTKLKNWEGRKEDPKLIASMQHVYSQWIVEAKITIKKWQGFVGSIDSLLKEREQQQKEIDELKHQNSCMLGQDKPRKDDWDNWLDSEGAEVIEQQQRALELAGEALEAIVGMEGAGHEDSECELCGLAFVHDPACQIVNAKRALTAIRKSKENLS